MKTRLLPIFMVLYCMTSSNVMANVATTAGSNLTAWNGNAGATNNNAWNTAMNNRTFATGPLGGSNAAVPRADFGNCNALIMRCAQPKCSGCTTMELAKPIVTGCVNSTDTCKKHGDELIEYISAQLVSDATAKATADANAANIAAANAAASAANNANNEQISQLQSQISQMAATQAESNRQMQQLTEQLQNATAQNNAAQNAAASAPASDTPSPTTNSDTTSDTSDATQVFKSSQFSDVENIAKKYDIDPDMAVRTMITGEIMTDIENAKDAMTKLKAAMNETFKYAGCNQYGANCSGPHRVKVFKEKAYQYFEPYDEVADHIYSALESALMVGADVNDIIMMLAGGCERWARYMCSTTGYTDYQGGGTTPAYVYPDFKYTADSCKEGRSVPNGEAETTQSIKRENREGVNTEPIKEKIIRGNMPCTEGAIVPPEDNIRCHIAEVITDDNRETLLTEWDNEMQDEGTYIRIGCASNALGALAMLNRRSSSTKKAMDVEILERMLAQDASDFTGRSTSGLRNYGSRANTDDAFDKYKYCALTVDGYNKLQTALAQRRMPAGEICMDYDDLFGYMYRSELIDWASIDTTGTVSSNTYIVPGFTCAANECDKEEWDSMKTSCEDIRVTCTNCSGTDRLQAKFSCTSFDDGNDKDNNNDSACNCQITNVESCERKGQQIECKKN